MKIIIYVDGKVFYSKRQFKKHLIKKGVLNKAYPCKVGTYWRTAYLERSYDRRVHTKYSMYNVRLSL